MKVNVSPALVLLILALSATLILKFSSPLFVFSVFNSIILAIITGRYRPSLDEVDGGWNYLPSSYEDANEDEDAYYNVKDEINCSDIDDDDECRKEDWFSDGYDEDDDESGSEGEIGWEDDDDVDENEQVDDSFRRRIEDFIAKVNKGWRDEWLREYLDDQ